MYADKRQTSEFETKKIKDRCNFHLETNKEKKAPKYQVPAYLCFIDLTHAFHKIEPNDIIAVLIKP